MKLKELKKLIDSSKKGISKYKKDTTVFGNTSYKKKF